MKKEDRRKLFIHAWRSYIATRSRDYVYREVSGKARKMGVDLLEADEIVEDALSIYRVKTRDLLNVTNDVADEYLDLFGDSDS